MNSNNIYPVLYTSQRHLDGTKALLGSRGKPEEGVQRWHSRNQNAHQIRSASILRVYTIILHYIHWVTIRYWLRGTEGGGGGRKWGFVQQTEQQNVAEQSRTKRWERWGLYYAPNRKTLCDVANRDENIELWWWDGLPKKELMMIWLQ